MSNKDLKRVDDTNHQEDVEQMDNEPLQYEPIDSENC